MNAFWRLLKAEREKLRRSSCVRLVWLLPLLFVFTDFFLFDYKLFGLKTIPDELAQVIDTLQIKMAGALWGGYFYPMLAALIPAMIFRVEHRCKTWNHLGVMPAGRSQVYLAKALWAVVLCTVSLVILWFLLMLEQSAMRFAAPHVQMRFHGLGIALTLGWLWLGSLPVTAIYLWMSNRINSLAVPVVFGVVGILLNSAMTSQDTPQPWKRDFIPWVTPNICVFQALQAADAAKNANPAGELFKEEPDVLRLYDGRKIRTWQNAPDDVLFPPPPPTPPLALFSYSIAAALAFLILGALDADICRTRGQ